MIQSLKDAKWWIIGGVVWAIISWPMIFIGSIRESIYLSIGQGIALLIIIIPALWGLFLLSMVWRDAPQSSEALIPTITLGVILGGLAGYLLYRIVKFFWPDKSRKDEELYDIHIKDYKD